MTEHILERYKDDVDFDKDVGEWLSDFLGELAQDEIDENIEEIKKSVNPKMCEKADDWKENNDG